MYVEKIQNTHKRTNHDTRTLMPWKVLKYLSGLASYLANSLARSGHT